MSELTDTYLTSAGSLALSLFILKEKQYPMILEHCFPRFVDLFTSYAPMVVDPDLEHIIIGI